MKLKHPIGERSEKGRSFLLPKFRIAECKALALYDTGVTAEYGDKLITLSTCEYSRTNGRMVVVAKQVSAPVQEAGVNEG